MSTAFQPGSGFKHGSAEVFGHRIGWTEAGEGAETLVICPGSAGSEPSWAKDLLSQHMRVIELNPPGWGGQSPLLYRIDQRDLATVLAAAVEALGVSQYHLHGASMGGVTALWMAAQFPARIRSLSIEGGMNFVRESDFVSVESIRILERMIAAQDPDGVGYPRAAPHARKPWLNANFFRNQMVKRLPMMRLVTNTHEDELRMCLMHFAVPTLVVLGDRDELLLPSHLDRWREVMPSAKTMLIPGGAHDVQNTEPEQLVDALSAHMREVSPLALVAEA